MPLLEAANVEGTTSIRVSRCLHGRGRAVAQAQSARVSTCLQDCPLPLVAVWWLRHERMPAGITLGRRFESALVRVSTSCSAGRANVPAREDVRTLVVRGVVVLAVPRKCGCDYIEPARSVCGKPQEDHLLMSSRGKAVAIAPNLVAGFVVWKRPNAAGTTHNLKVAGSSPAAASLAAWSNGSSPGTFLIVVGCAFVFFGTGRMPGGITARGCAA